MQLSRTRLLRVLSELFHVSVSMFLLFLFVPAYAQQDQNRDNSSDSEKAPPNFLLILGDDMGVETLPCYGVGSNTAVTPTLDSLCDEGVRFDNMWSQPVCSPTRATVMTGRYGFRTGIGHAITLPKEYELAVPDKPEGAHRESDRRSPVTVSPPGLSLDELTLPLALKSNPELGYEAGAFGKWHLADASNGYEKHPILAGFDYFAGNSVGALESYFAYSKQINGEATPGSTVYVGKDKVNEAIRWISERDPSRPWLTYLAFNLPHSPFHLPPLDLLNSEARELDPFSDDVNTAPLPYFQAMVEAMDTQIARVINALSAEQRRNTYVIFLGDNGTSRDSVSLPFEDRRVKSTVYQGGVNVPFIVTGPGIEGGRVSDALLNSVDVYTTILDLASIDVDAVKPADKTVDGVSFAAVLNDADAQPARDFAYADVFSPVKPTSRAIRTETYKLLVIDGVEELYNLKEDPYEHNNLLSADLSVDARKNYDDLKSRMQALLATEPDLDP